MLQVFKWIRKLRRMKDMFCVEYQTSTMLEPRMFAYEYYEERYETNELIFTHESANQTLTINKAKIEWFTTSKFGIDKTFFNN